MDEVLPEGIPEDTLPSTQSDLLRANALFVTWLLQHTHTATTRQMTEHGADPPSEPADTPLT